MDEHNGRICMCDGGGSVAHIPSDECTSGTPISIMLNLELNDSIYLTESERSIYLKAQSAISRRTNGEWPHIVVELLHRLHRQRGKFRKAEPGELL